MAYNTLIEGTAVEEWKAVFCGLIRKIEEKFGPCADWSEVPVAEAFSLMSDEEHDALSDSELPMNMDKVETAYDLRREWQVHWEAIHA